MHNLFSNCAWECDGQPVNIPALRLDIVPHTESICCLAEWS